jgi:hypothetical protein
MYVTTGDEIMLLIFLKYLNRKIKEEINLKLKKGHEHE